MSTLAMALLVPRHVRPGLSCIGGEAVGRAGGRSRVVDIV